MGSFRDSMLSLIESKSDKRVSVLRLGNRFSLSLLGFASSSCLGEAKLMAGPP